MTNMATINKIYEHKYDEQSKSVMFRVRYPTSNKFISITLWVPEWEARENGQQAFKDYMNNIQISNMMEALTLP